MIETKKRTLIKTVSWRIIATCTTIVVAYILTRSLKLAFGVGCIDTLVKTVFYYFHERVWCNCDWGIK